MELPNKSTFLKNNLKVLASPQIHRAPVIESLRIIAW